MNRDYKALLEAGNKAQLEKLNLSKNEDKEGFEDLPVGMLTNRINDELEELYDEMPLPRNYVKIRHEAADIANFAHMIILACDKELLK